VAVTVAPRTTSPTAVAALVLTVAGLLVSAYLTYEHYTSGHSFACPESATINCVKVTTSAYSSLAGIPVALLGLLFYVAMVVLSAPVASLKTRQVARLRLVMASLGVVFVLYLVWAELFRIDAICLWCTAVHVITVALFGVLTYEAL
jgi:uncharacterized membrane protein